MKTWMILSAALAAAGAAADSPPVAPAPARTQGVTLSQTLDQAVQAMRNFTAVGHVDRDFVHMMAMHHRHGIQMAEIAVRDGQDAKAKALAGRIMESQKRELRELERWISENPQFGR